LRRDITLIGKETNKNINSVLIEYKNVDINQLSQQVLSNINLQINQGELVYITGKVGTGKSSFIKTLYGELPIESGDAMVMGYDMSKIKQSQIPHLRRKIGIIFQDFQLLTDRSVEENLRFVLKATGWKKGIDINNRINEVLQMVGMSTKGYKYPNELSGGEQQRIAIARAILNNPQLILADEPTANLDEETGKQIAELLMEICRQGSTVIIITHNMELLRLYPGRTLQCKDHQLTEIEISNTDK
jgi:cell division transport system ATP-binding protein